MSDFLSNPTIPQAIFLFAVVIAVGLFLGRFKVKGVSIGSTWILFMGILLSHFGFKPDNGVLAFVKDFGLILFVFSIGLQVGPGFFRSFKKGGVVMNALALLLVVLAVVVTVIIHLVTGEDLLTMTGVMSGAVTNTPGLGAAQNTISNVMLATGRTVDEAGQASAGLAGAYAVAYPLGVIGIIFSLILFKSLGKIDTQAESDALDREGDKANSAMDMMFQVENPSIVGRTIAQTVSGLSDLFVVSKVIRSGQEVPMTGDFTFLEGDRVQVVAAGKDAERISILFGKPVPMVCEEEVEPSEDSLMTKNLTVTDSKITGKTIRDLGLRHAFGVTVTQVQRSGINFVASPNLILEVGDELTVIGERDEIKKVADVVGNKTVMLSHPNLVPIFLGITLGVVLGSLPIKIPGVPQPIKLGLAGGPLIVSILLGYFGPRLKITTYTTVSANLLLREIGISLFMAAVGLGAGENFVSSIMGGGYIWILYGFLITVIPIAIVMVIARLVCKLNFYQICGLITGGCTNPPGLAFAQGAYGTSYTSVNYATVYPLTMFLRVLAAQLLVLFAL